MPFLKDRNAPALRHVKPLSVDDAKAILSFPSKNDPAVYIISSIPVLVSTILGQKI